MTGAWLCGSDTGPNDPGYRVFLMGTTLWLRCWCCRRTFLVVACNWPRPRNGRARGTRETCCVSIGRTVDVCVVHEDA